MTNQYATQLMDDFALNDNLESVSLTNAVTGVVVSGILAKNRRLDFREASLGASLGLEPTDQVFTLCCKQLGSAIPNRGDTITTEDGNKWTIVSSSVVSVGATPVHRDVIVRRQYQ